MPRETKSTHNTPAKKQMAIEAADVAGGYLAFRPATDGLTVASVIRENAGPTGIQQSDLQRVRVPTGGGLSWEKATIEGVVSEPSLTGIIVEHLDVRAYWPDLYEGGNTPPQCSSDDCETGHGDPGGECIKCVFSKFGTKLDAKGKATDGQACKQMKILFVLEPDNFLPTVVIAPPTSLQGVRKYLLGLASRAYPFWTVTTVLSLESTKSAGGIKYSRIVPVLGTKLPPEIISKVKAYRDALLPALKRIRAEQGDVEE